MPRAGGPRADCAALSTLRKLMEDVCIPKHHPQLIRSSVGLRQAKKIIVIVVRNPKASSILSRVAIRFIEIDIRF